MRRFLCDIGWFRKKHGSVTQLPSSLASRPGIPCISPNKSDKMKLYPSYQDHELGLPEACLRRDNDQTLVSVTSSRETTEDPYFVE